MRIVVWPYGVSAGARQEYPRIIDPHRRNLLLRETERNPRAKLDAIRREDVPL